MSMTVLRIARLEGLWAVVDYSGTQFRLPRWLLPATAKIGDILTVTIALSNSDSFKKEMQKTASANE